MMAERTTTVRGIVIRRLTSEERAACIGDRSDPYYLVEYCYAGVWFRGAFHVSEIYNVMEEHQYNVVIRTDAYETEAEAGQAAITQAKEEAPDYRIPADWRAFNTNPLGKDAAYYWFTVIRTSSGRLT